MEKLDNADVILTNLNKTNINMGYVCDILLEMVKEQPENSRLVNALRTLSQERVNLRSCIAFTAENIPSNNLEGNVRAAREINAETKERDNAICSELGRLAIEEANRQNFSR